MKQLIKQIQNSASKGNVVTNVRINGVASDEPIANVAVWRNNVGDKYSNFTLILMISILGSLLSLPFFLYSNDELFSFDDQISEIVGSIFFTIFQTFMTGTGEETEDVEDFDLKRYEEYPPEFFDPVSYTHLTLPTILLV